MNTQELNELLSCLTSNWPALKKSMQNMGQSAHANHCNGRKCRTYTSNIKN